MTQVICSRMKKITRAKPYRMILGSPLPRIHYYQSQAVTNIRNLTKPFGLSQNTNIHLNHYRKLKEVKPEIETPTAVKRTIGAKPKEKGNSLPKNQSGPQVKHVCHHYGIQGHTRPNVSSFMLSRRLPLCVAKKVQREDQKEHKLREIMRDISLETLWKC